MVVPFQDTGCYSVLGPWREGVVGGCRVGCPVKVTGRNLLLVPPPKKTLCWLLFQIFRSNYHVRTNAEFPELQIISPSPSSWGKRLWATQWPPAWGESLRARHLYFAPLNCILCEELRLNVFSRVGPPSQVESFQEAGYFISLWGSSGFTVVAFWFPVLPSH